MDRSQPETGHPGVAAVLDRAYRLEEAGAFHEALAAYEQALGQSPEDAEIHNTRGIVSERLGQLPQAEQHYLNALKFDPAYADVHHNLGMLYQQQQRNPDAQAEFEAFLSLSTNRKEVNLAKSMLTQVTGKSYEKCAECGVISTLAHYYRGGSTKRCPRCETRSQLKSLSTSFLLTVVGLPILTGFAYLLDTTLYYFMANLALAFLLIYPLVIPHELCHAAALRAVGGTLFEIRFGAGPAIWERRIGTFTLSFTRHPFAGLCLAGFPHREHLAKRFLVFVSAGPLFNVAMILLGLLFIHPSRMLSHVGLVEAFVLANLMALLVNLTPRTVSVGDLQAATDGLNLLQLIMGKFPIEKVHLAYYLGKATYARKQKALDQALEACEAGLVAYPQNVLLTNFKWVVLLEMGHYAQARGAFQKLLSRFQGDDRFEDVGIDSTNREMVKAFLLNNVAYASLLGADSEDAPQQACVLAKEAFRMAPWVSSVRGTLGAALIEIGQIQQGLDHLVRAFQDHDNASSKASALAHMAVAYHRLGDKAQATAKLNEALALDADQHVVRKLQAELFPAV